MLYLLIALQLADIATTHYALRTGMGTEANHVLRKMFDKFGHEPVLAIKGAFIAWLWWLCRYGYWNNPYEVEARAAESKMT